MFSEFDLGLEEQYTSSYLMFYNRIIIFPKVINIEYIKYLVSLDFVCVVGSLYNKLYNFAAKETGIIWLSRGLHDSLTDSKFLIECKDYLIPLDNSLKNQFIHTYNLERIDD